MTDPHAGRDQPELTEAGNVHALAGQPPLGLTARAEVDRIIDGDTLDVHLRLPCRIRLLDCWAPEQRSPGGLASKEHLQKLLPDGSHVVVQIPTRLASSVKDVMTFGRVLGHVWHPGDEESISQMMVACGHATVGKVQ